MDVANGPKNVSALGPDLLRQGVVDPLKTIPSPIGVSMPNFIVVV